VRASAEGTSRIYQLDPRGIGGRCGGGLDEHCVRVTAFQTLCDRNPRRGTGNAESAPIVQKSRIQGPPDEHSPCSPGISGMVAQRAAGSASARVTDHRAAWPAALVRNAMQRGRRNQGASARRETRGRMLLAWQLATGWKL